MLRTPPCVAAAPSTPAATASPTATGTATAQGGSAKDTSPAIWALGGLTGLFVLAVVGILLITRRRPKAPE